MRLLSAARLTALGLIHAGLAIGVLGRLLSLVLGRLCRSGRHDAVIMLRVLKIVLGHHPVAGGIGIPRQLEIFLIDMGSRAADFDFRTGGIERAIGIVTAAAIAAATTTAAAITVLRPAAASA